MLCTSSVPPDFGTPFKEICILPPKSLSAGSQARIREGATPCMGAASWEPGDMKIEAVDFFYLAMPQITTEADGSQDALLVRVAGGGHVGWGECEASPLVSIAAFVCPMSHGVCRPVSASVLGETLASPADIARIGARVAYDSMDLLQAPHTFSGVEMALWDLLGKKNVRAGLAPSRLSAFLREASLCIAALWRHTAANIGTRARGAGEGFLAVKFGWGPIGRTDADADREQFQAAREGLGDATLLVDVGQIGAGTLRRRQRGCRTWRRLTPYGLRNPSLPVRFQPMRRSPSAARRSSSPEARPPTIPRWRSI